MSGELRPGTPTHDRDGYLLCCRKCRYWWFYCSCEFFEPDVEGIELPGPEQD
jgi:hypothetical protein